ncbi:unnamed protein product [Boreogadus saida]
MWMSTAISSVNSPLTLGTLNGNGTAAIKRRACKTRSKNPASFSEQQVPDSQDLGRGAPLQDPVRHRGPLASSFEQDTSGASQPKQK